MQCRERRAIWNSSIDSCVGRNNNNVPWLQIGGDCRIFKQDMQEIRKMREVEHEEVQETPEGKNVVRQSAKEYLEEVLGKEFTRIWRN